MPRKYTAPTGPGTLGLLSSTGPLIKKPDRTASGKDIRLEVDGGIKVDNIRRVADAGADTFVAGSAIFGKPDYRVVIDNMRRQLGA